MEKFNFLNLDSETRQWMLSEIEFDKQRNQIYISDRLNELGKAKYLDFLIRSVKEGDEVMFENLLDFRTYFNSTDKRNDDTVKMPFNASKLLCQSEFNRYYIRAICLRAIYLEIKYVEVYRARESKKQRKESELRIGELIDAQELLEDLRNSIGKEPKLLPEINSGLSVKI
ncbi:MAG: hypothetical protein QXL18_05305 [Candidatus Woesearchaeota archaeon]